MSSLLRDLRYAWRHFRGHPRLTTVLILTLALGIGASTAVYSAIQAVLLAPLPYPEPLQTVRMYSRFPASDKFALSPPEYYGLRDRARSFEHLGAYMKRNVNLASRGEPLRVEAVRATADIFPTLGARPKLGGFFTAAEDAEGVAPVVVLGEGVWRRAFGGDPGLIGGQISVDGVERTVVGVMPLEVGLEGHAVDVWVPLGLPARSVTMYGAHMLNVVGRLRPGVTVEAARREVDSLVERWPLDLPSEHTPSTADHPLLLVSLLDDLVGEVRPAMRLLAVAVGFLLLIACANAASLLLARAESRQKEIALRVTLGADRGRLLRQFLTESVLLTLLAGSLGLLLAGAGVRAMIAFAPEGVPRFETTRVDGASLLFTLAVCIGTGLLFGLAPALHAAGRSLATAVKAGGGRATAGVARQWLRGALVVFEIALATMLLCSAGLLLRSFRSLLHVDAGFRSQGVLSFEVAPNPATYTSSRQVLAFYQQLLDRLSALPGVESAAAVAGLPPKRAIDNNDMDFEGLPPDPQGPPRAADYWQFVTRDYFRTMNIPLIRGRLFTASDGAEAPAVVVINQTMARTFWPGQDPIGRRIKVPGEEMPWLTIVGVTGDVKQGGLDQKTGTEVYFLLDQAWVTVGGAPLVLSLVLRSRDGDPFRLAGSVQTEVRRVDPTVPVSDLKPLQQVVASSMARPRFLSFLVSVFATLALVLAAIGAYSVLAYAVEQRRGEIGVRMALGARTADVIRMVLVQGGRLAALGGVLGLLLALALGRFLSSLLFGVQASDPWTLIGVMVLLGAVSLLATYLPARQAARIPPQVALRAE